MVKPVQV